MLSICCVCQRLLHLFLMVRVTTRASFQAWPGMVIVGGCLSPRHDADRVADRPLPTLELYNPAAPQRGLLALLKHALWQTLWVDYGPPSGACRWLRYCLPRVLSAVLTPVVSPINMPVPISKDA